MFCVIQEIERKKPPRPGEYKELRAYPLEMSVGGVWQKPKYCYEHTGGRFDRPIRTAYKISIHESKRVHGVVTKKQYPVTTVGYYDLADFALMDCVNSGKVEAIAADLDTSANALWELLYAKVDPLQERIWAEFGKTEEHKAHTKHQKVLKKHHAAKQAFKTRYGVDEYDYCYNVFGDVMNQAYLDEIIKAASQKQQAYSSYYESASSNYGYSSTGYDYSSLFSSASPTYSTEDRERLKKFYKSLSKIYHPDVNRDADTHEEMVLLNKLKEEWGV